MNGNEKDNARICISANVLAFDFEKGVLRTIGGTTIRMGNEEIKGINSPSLNKDAENRQFDFGYTKNSIDESNKLDKEPNIREKSLEERANESII